jgi:hypothetical protein
LPGDKLKLDLVQKGSEAGQAIGYLADGTMVVVEDAASDIGKAVEIEFIRYLQTSAGKMMFAKKAVQKIKPPQPSRQPRARQVNRPKEKANAKVSDRNNNNNNKTRTSNQRKPRRRETGEERLVRLANNK